MIYIWLVDFSNTTHFNFLARFSYEQESSCHYSVDLRRWIVIGLDLSQVKIVHVQKHQTKPFYVLEYINKIAKAFLQSGSL